MSTIKSSAEHLTLNADGASKDIKFQANGVEKASISSAGAFTSTTIDATKLTGTIPNFTSTGIDDNADATAITIDSAENVGIGVTPESSLSSQTALQVGGTGVITSSTTAAAGADTHYGQNAYLNTSGAWAYQVTDEATLISQNDGNLRFRVAPSGTADAAITWTTALDIKNDGRGLSQFTAKAWINFDGTGTIAIRDSHNVSSIVDNNVGQYTTNWSNSMANGSYSCVASCPTNNTGGSVGGCYATATASASHEFRICSTQASGDQNRVYVIAFGD